MMVVIKEVVSEEILNAVAPCSLFCLTCTGCKYGLISEHAKELLNLLEGHEEFLDKNLKKEYRSKLDEYRVFSKRLKKFAYPKCGGCRNGKSSSCSIKGCIILDCVKEKNINSCAECTEFPCDKVNESVYKKNVIDKWKDGNYNIREYGVERYYEENKKKSHYIDYKK